MGVRLLARECALLPLGVLERYGSKYLLLAAEIDGRVDTALSNALIAQLVDVNEGLNILNRTAAALCEFDELLCLDSIGLMGDGKQRGETALPGRFVQDSAS